MTRAARRPSRAGGLWKASVGSPPTTVTVFERAAGGPLWIRWYDAEAAAPVRKPLGHRSREKALAAASHAHTLLAHGRQAMTGEPVVPGAVRDAATGDAEPTVAGILALYLAQRTPHKRTRQQRQEDERRAEMWTRVYGAKLVRSLDATAWSTFVEWRRSGAITALGVWVEDEADRRPCGARGVDADLVFLLSVFNWACQLMRPSPDGPRPVLARNPWAGAGPGAKRLLARPAVERPRTPVATTPRYEALRVVAATVTVRLPTAAGTYALAPSYLETLLDLAYHTGRRIEALVRLTWAACHRDAAGRIVAITWPTLKAEQARTVPVRAEVTAALAAHEARWRAWAAWTGRPDVVEGPVFPGPRSWRSGPSEALRPMTRWVARDWLVRAETAAGLDHLDGGGWHPFRRAWITRRRHVPAKAAMEAVGMRDRRTFERYIQVDDAALVDALHDDRPLGIPKTASGTPEEPPNRRD